MLSERQRAAAHRLGQDVCVVAGPGSGKTSVLIERFASLVRVHGVSPRQILAITFTEKAATEIRQRMMRAFEDAPEMRHEIERAWVSTIHAFCARLLRENAIEAGVDPEFAVLDQSHIVLREVADKALEAMFRDDPPRMRRLLQSLAVATSRDGYVPDLATSLIEIYQAVRLAGASLEDLRRRPAGDASRLQRLREIALAIRADSPAIRTANQTRMHREALDWVESVLALPDDAVTEEHVGVASRKQWHKGQLVKTSAAYGYEDELRELCDEVRSDFILQYYESERGAIVDALENLDEAYRFRKRSTSSLDFDDLEENAIYLLETNEALREEVRNSFDFILMDELQDTNPLQWRLMELVRSPGSFFAVGDVNQSIYGFRHARPELFRDYRSGLESAGLEVDELRDNYRTRPEVLAIVNKIFAAAPGVEAHTLLAGASFAPKTAESGEVVVAFAENGAEAERIEAETIARRITELVGVLPVDDRVARYGDFAILTRANYSTAELQRALDRFGVPSLVVGGLTFFDTREVRDLKLLLDVLINPRNEIALAGLLRSPLFGLTDEDLLRRVLDHTSLHDSVQRDPPPDWENVVALREQRNVVSPDRLLRRALDGCDYEGGLSDRGRANVGKFLAMIRERYQRRPASLAELVAEIELASPEAEAPPSEAGNAVRLMTMHKAKGLEFPVVILPFLHKGRNNTTPIISYTHQHGLGVKWRNPVNAENLPDAISKANDRAAAEAQRAEENRLLYVGCTRAKEHLILSWCVTENVRGTWSGFVAGQLGADPVAATNEAVFQDGLRIYSTDRRPAVAAAAAAGATMQLPRVIPGADVADLADSAATVTDVSQFSECPRKYYLGRYLREEKRAPRSLLTEDEDFEDLDAKEVAESGSELGVQVHALLAGQAVPSPSVTALALAGKFRESPIYRRLQRASRAEREWDFVSFQGGMVLRGQIDLWFEEGRELLLVDYKTDQAVTEDSVAAYGVQLQIYALALQQATGRTPDRAVLVFLRSGAEIDVDLTPLACGAALETIHSFRHAQSHTAFPLRPGARCRRCEFFGGACPAGNS